MRSATTVRDGEADRVGARHIGHERRHRARRVHDHGRATRRTQGKGPAVAERVAIDIRRPRAVQRDSLSGDRGLIGPRVGDRIGVGRRGRHDDDVDSAAQHTIVDGEIDLVAPSDVDGEGRHDGRGARQRGRAARRAHAQSPEIRERIAVGIARGRAVERHDVADERDDIGTGIGDRSVIARRDRALRQRALQRAEARIVGGDDQIAIRIARVHRPRRGLASGRGDQRNVIAIDIVVAIDVAHLWRGLRQYRNRGECCGREEEGEQKRAGYL